MALARAIAFSPTVVLFDEPLSNLDAKLRAEMRVELRELRFEPLCIAQCDVRDGMQPSVRFADDSRAVPVPRGHVRGERGQRS